MNKKILYTFIAYNMFITTNVLPLNTNLEITCIHEILKTKLYYAAQKNDIDVNTLTTDLANLYENCNSSINPSNQTCITQEEWINKFFYEIQSLKKNPTVHKCFSNAIENLENSRFLFFENFNPKAINDFYTKLQECQHAYIEKISLEHLQAAIQRWEGNPDQTNCDMHLWFILLKHTPEKKSDFNLDMKNWYERNFDPKDQSFDDVIALTEKRMNRLQQDQEARLCIQSMLYFQTHYFNEIDTIKKAQLTKDFAQTYLACKNK